MDSSLQKAIDHASVVSFDVFDTLIKRNCANPTDIFTITEKRFNRQNGDKITGFKKARIEAERYARTLEETGEIGFDAIYDNLNFPHKDKLKQLELLCEEVYCVPNKRLKAIYDYCIEKNKTVVCISDMYLPSEEIRKILENAGYQNIKKIYVSNEYKKTKRKGDLFDEALKDFLLKSSQLVHIGDNWRSDYLMPKIKGIKAFHFSRKVINVKYGKEVQKQEGLNIIGSVLNNTTEEGEDFYRFGYEVLGPFCVEFCLWIKKQMEEQGKEKLFFCARDMQLMKDIFIQLFPSFSEQCKYFYVSRKSIVLPYLYVNDTWEGFLNCLSTRFTRKLTVDEVLDWLGVSDDLHKEVFCVSDVSTDNTFTINEFKRNNKIEEWFYNKLYPVIQGKCKEQYAYFKGYIDKLGLTAEKALIIDAGWRGTVQSFLSVILKQDLQGIYIGLETETIDGLTKANAKAFAFDARNGLNSEYGQGRNSVAFKNMFEKVISAQHGTTIGYNKKYSYDLDVEYKSQKVFEVHSGALAFAKNIKDYITDIDINKHSSYFASLIRIVISPTYQEACLLGDMKHDDFNVSYFAKPNTLSNYIKNPKGLANDFFASPWKIGFLKRLLRVSFPYFELYKLGIRFREIWSK